MKYIPLQGLLNLGKIDPFVVAAVSSFTKTNRNTINTIK